MYIVILPVIPRYGLSGYRCLHPYRPEGFRMGVEVHHRYLPGESYVRSLGIPMSSPLSPRGVSGGDGGCAVQCCLSFARVGLVVCLRGVLFDRCEL